MNDNTSLVSVVMPVYNCENFIEEAIGSILKQSYKNFELLVIDDASTDKTVDFIETLNDDRIVLIKKKQNSGYTNSLNLGLKEAKGKYIARMDGDDISHPERFMKQIHFMESRPEIVLCGTQYKIIGRQKFSKHPLNHDDIKIALINGSVIAHPSVMILKSFLDANNLEYNTLKEPAEDHDLWSRIIFLGETANLNENLLEYRVHNNQVSSKRKQAQLSVSNDIKERMLSVLYKGFKTINDANFNSCNINEAFLIYSNLRKCYKTLNKQNISKRIYNKKKFTDFCNNEIKKIDLKLIKKVENNSFFVLKKQLFNFTFFKNLGVLNSFKFVIKSLFF